MTTRVVFDVFGTRSQDGNQRVCGHVAMREKMSAVTSTRVNYPTVDYEMDTAIQSSPAMSYIADID